MAATFVALAVSAHASPVVWTLTGIVFNVFSDPGDVGMTGSFVYDADTETFSSISLSTEKSDLSGNPYTIEQPNDTVSLSVWNEPPVGDMTGHLQAVLWFDAGTLPTLVEVWR